MYVVPIMMTAVYSMLGSNLLCGDFFALKHRCWVPTDIGANLLHGPIGCMTKFSAWGQIHIHCVGSNLMYGYLCVLEGLFTSSESGYEKE